MTAALAEFLGPYRVVAGILVVAVIVFLAIRVALLVAYTDATSLEPATVAKLLWVGLRFDLLVAFWLILWQTLHITFVPSRRLLGPVSRTLLELEWLSAFFLLPLVAVVEWLFFEEFESRLNYIAFEYLVYPTEVACNIWESYAVVPYLAVIVVGGGLGYLVIRKRLLKLVERPLSWQQRAVVLVTVLAALVSLAATTGMQSREFCDNRIVVECAGNGLYSFVYYAWTCRFDYDQHYVTLPASAVTRQVRGEVVGSRDRLAESPNPVDRVVDTGRSLRDWNVVLILEESFGSNFVGVLGDSRGLTLQFDRLSRHGLLFDNFYATGNRTARALEAILTSMPPIPTESILKRDHSNHVYTLANVLADRG
ncbi:MAG: sulfatase-like hydrolase/transferase, partial [Planctomycetes bacterium]|nr:sulfatase-like hydrolase/transferase [Planctomycetota bacterium]